MFCPNCGSQNPETSQNCNKCGFRLKAVAAPKFKGTMLMDAPVIPGVTPAAPASPKVAPGAPGPANPRVSARSKLHGTMLGVAPPSAGAIVPPSAPSAQAPRGHAAAGAGQDFGGSTLLAGTAPKGAEGFARTAAQSELSPQLATAARTGPMPAASPVSAPQNPLASTQVISAAPPPAQELHERFSTPAPPSPEQRGFATAATAVSAMTSSPMPPSVIPDSAPPWASEPPSPGALQTGPMSAFEPKSTPSQAPVQDSLGRGLEEESSWTLKTILLTVCTFGLYLLFRGRRSGAKEL